MFPSLIILLTELEEYNFNMVYRPETCAHPLMHSQEYPLAWMLDKFQLKFGFLFCQNSLILQGDYAVKGMRGWVLWFSLKQT